MYAVSGDGRRSVLVLLILILILPFIRLEAMHAQGYARAHHALPAAPRQCFNMCAVCATPQISVNVTRNGWKFRASHRSAGAVDGRHGCHRGNCRGAGGERWPMAMLVCHSGLMESRAVLEGQAKHSSILILAKMGERAL